MGYFYAAIIVDRQQGCAHIVRMVCTVNTQAHTVGKAHTLIKNGKIIGEGYHARYGEAHAERNALQSCRESPQGADLYVTLEPCCHYGKTPPCTEAIIKNGIKRVIVGSFDCNPLVAGKGIQVLRDAGIEVIFQNTCLHQSIAPYLYGLPVCSW